MPTIHLSRIGVVVEARHELAPGNRVGEAAIGGQRRQGGDEGLQPQDDDQYAVERAGQRSDEQRHGKDDIAGDVENQRQVEHHHADKSDDRPDRKIDAAHQDRECLAHRQDGDEGEPGHQIFKIARAWRSAGRSHKKMRSSQQKTGPALRLRDGSSRIGFVRQKKGRGGYATAQGAEENYQRWDGWIVSDILLGGDDVGHQQMALLAERARRTPPVATTVAAAAASLPC